MLNIAGMNEILNYAVWLENLGGREHLGGLVACLEVGIRSS